MVRFFFVFYLKLRIVKFVSGLVGGTRMIEKSFRLAKRAHLTGEIVQTHVGGTDLLEKSFTPSKQALLTGEIVQTHLGGTHLIKKSFRPF